MTATWASAGLPLGAAAPAPEARRRGRPPAARTPLGPPGPGGPGAHRGTARSSHPPGSRGRLSRRHHRRPPAHRACACGSSPGAGPLGLFAQFPALLRGSVGVWLRRCRRPRGPSAQPAREVGCAAARGLPLAAPDPGAGRLSAGRPVPPTGVRPRLPFRLPGPVSAPVRPLGPVSAPVRLPGPVSALARPPGLSRLPSAHRGPSRPRPPSAPTSPRPDNPRRSVPVSTRTCRDSRRCPACIVITSTPTPGPPSWAPTPGGPTERAVRCG